MTAGFAIAGAPWQLFVFSFVGFALNTVGMVVWNALMQTRVPSEMLGRVSSLDWFVSRGPDPRLVRAHRPDGRADRDQGRR